MPPAGAAGEASVDEDLNDEQQLLLDATARFTEEAYPIARLRACAHDDPGVAAAYRRQAAELGWFGLVVPEAQGGGSASGNGVVDAALVAYRRGRRLQPGPFVGTNVVAAAVAAAGGDEHRNNVLPALVAGEVSASWAYGAAPALPARAGEITATATATASADGHRLSGRATFVEDPGPDGWLLVTATTAEGAAQFLLPVDAAGVEVVALESLDLSRRFVEVRLHHAVAPPASAVGQPGGIDEQLADQLALAAVLTTAETVGAMAFELEMTVQYAKDRIAFGRPIGSFQAIKHLLADTSLNLEMSKALTLAAAACVGEGDPHGRQLASMAKAFVGDCGIELAQGCFQVFGGIGYTWEHDQHLFLRRISTDAAFHGDPAWHRERLCQLAGI